MVWEGAQISQGIAIGHWFNQVWKLLYKFTCIVNCILFGLVVTRTLGLF